MFYNFLCEILGDDEIKVAGFVQLLRPVLLVEKRGENVLELVVNEAVFEFFLLLSVGFPLLLLLYLFLLTNRGGVVHLLLGLAHLLNLGDGERTALAVEFSLGETLVVFVKNEVEIQFKDFLVFVNLFVGIFHLEGPIDQGIFGADDLWNWNWVGS